MSNSPLENFTIEELEKELQSRKENHNENEKRQRIINSKAMYTMLLDFPDAFKYNRERILKSFGNSPEDYNYSIDCYYDKLED